MWARKMQLAVALAGVASGAALADAQPCSTSDQAFIEQRARQAVAVLVAGDVRGYVDLVKDPDPRLSASCRAALARLSPTITRCTSRERQLVLERYVTAIEAAGSGNLLEMLETLEELQESVTPACWAAVNYPQDPGVLMACSAEELNLLAANGTDSLPLLRRLLTTGDFSELIQKAVTTLAQLSEPCGAAVRRAQPAAQPPSGSRTPEIYRPQNVFDHGGGTYSVSGVGACGPSGCVAF